MLLRIADVQNAAFIQHHLLQRVTQSTCEWLQVSEALGMTETPKNREKSQTGSLTSD